MPVSSLRTEREYVCDQYKNKDNLQIRIRTHELYSEPKIEFPEWVLDHVVWNGTENVVDIGSGSGEYIRPASRRCARYIAADLSFGMLAGLALPVPDRINLDATRIPIAGNSIDVVLANHMLYHISELSRAIEEIFRVLHPPGVLIAATNSEKYMPELAELQVKVARRMGIDKHENWQDPPQIVHTFSLENGRLFLESFFQTIERYDLPGALVFPESEPVIEYLASMQESFQATYPNGITWDDVIPEIQAEIDAHIRRHGEYRVHKQTGVFICRKVS